MPLDATAAVLEERSAGDEARALETRYGHLEPELIIELSIDRFFAEEIATVSSFGAESAVLLHMIAQVDPTLPVLFLETGKHFDATLAYRDELARHLGLTNVIDIRPRAETVKEKDPFGILFSIDKDGCCHIRKVEPLARAVSPYRAWFTGRKQFQAATRTVLPAFEAVGPRVRINPLARWRSADLAAYMRKHGLPAHPLVEKGYRSIGCQACTRPVADGEDDRAGRWAGTNKIECGIHLSGLEGSLRNISFTDSSL
jgi:phosphoadenosine phosphosulfate reductase